MTYFECGCCGYFHPAKLNKTRARLDYVGPDCRDDENRFTMEQIEALDGPDALDRIIYLES